MKKILMVMDLDMKRADSSTDFHRTLIEECRIRGVIVEFLLPTEPCLLVKEKLRDTAFVYTVIPFWWDKMDRMKRHHLLIVLPILCLIIKHNIDLVTFHFCAETTAFFVAMFCKLIGKKVKFIWYQRLEVRSEETRRLLKIVKEHFSKIRIISLVMNHFVAVSFAVRHQLQGKHIKESQVSVLYNGMDLRCFSPGVKRSDVFDLISGVQNATVLTTVANLIPAKGVDYLIEAVSLIRQQGFSVVCFIVGEGPHLVTLQQKTYHFGVSQNFYFVGKRSDVPSIMLYSDIIVHPTLKESFGNVILEAMASGKAVVASAVGGIPEMIENGVNGLLVQPADALALSQAIIRLLRNKELIKSMGKQGRRIAEERFDLSKRVVADVDLYERYL